MKNIAAIIPAYNPQQSLITYVHQLLATTITQIIIVNDGVIKNIRIFLKT